MPTSLATAATACCPAVTPHGTAELAAGVKAHLDAGADHVVIQPLAGGGTFALDDLPALAEASPACGVSEDAGPSGSALVRGRSSRIGQLRRKRLVIPRRTVLHATASAR